MEFAIEPLEDLLFVGLQLWVLLRIIGSSKLLQNSRFFENFSGHQKVTSLSGSYFPAQIPVLNHVENVFLNPFMGGNALLLL